jgi:hypothetical protein
MNEITVEDALYLFGGVSFLILSIAIFLFRCISVKHIEREMAKEGIEQPLWDKGIGSIIVTYSLIMIFSKLNPTIVDFDAVRRHTRKKDKYLALFLQIFNAIFLTIIFTVYYLYVPDS